MQFFRSSSHLTDGHVKAFERFVEVLPSLRAYVKGVKENKLANPGTSSFQMIASGVQDRSLEAKLKFCISVSKSFQPFLLKFQTDKPVLPFLVPDLRDLVKELLQKFVASCSLAEVSSVSRLLKEDFEKRECHREVDLGFAAEKYLS